MEKKKIKKKTSLCHECLEDTKQSDLVKMERGDKKNHTDYYVRVCSSCYKKLNK